MKVSIQQKRNSLFLVYRFQGKRHWEALHLTLTGDKVVDKKTHNLAEQARAQREQQIMSRQWDLQDPSVSKLIIGDYARKISKDMPKSYHIPKVIKYLDRFAPELVITSVNEQWLRDFQKFLQRPDKNGNRSINDTTASNYYAAVKTILHTALRERVILRDPSQFVRGIPCPEPDKVWLTEEELKRLTLTEPMGKLGKATRQGFLFACNTGLRVSDVRSLTWGMIRRGIQPCIVKDQQKTRDMVTIPLNTAALSLIADAIIHPVGAKVFPLLSASKTEPSQYFRDWEKKAKIYFHIGWHTARHTFAVQLLIAGTDIYTVSKLLGHKSIKTTEVYLRAVDPMKRAAVEKLPSIGII